MIILSVLIAIVVAVIVIGLVVTFLNRFYRKSTRDLALVRTGFGGQRIIVSGGCVALPFLHRVEEVNMRTVRIEVRRAAEKSLITEDRMRVDVEFEFYVRVLPTAEGIATAAQALGAKSLNPDGIRNLLEGRFIDAIQAVAGRQTMDLLHERRAEFAQQIAEQLRDNLSQNGILLDSVSLTRLDQSAFSAFDENNAFNAVGMRKLAEIIAVNKKKRAEIEADADTSVRQTQLDATKRRLLLSMEEEQAQMAQRLEIEKIKASSDAEAAKAREDGLASSEEARIGRERQTNAMELAKKSELRKIEIGRHFFHHFTADRLLPHRKPERESVKTEIVDIARDAQTQLGDHLASFVGKNPLSAESRDLQAVIQVVAGLLGREATQAPDQRNPLS